MIGRLQLFWYASKRRGLVVLGSGLTAVGVIGDLVSDGLGLGSLAFVVLPVVLAGVDWGTIKKDGKNLVVVTTTFDPSTQLAALDDGWTPAQPGSSIFLTSQQVDEHLRNHPIPIRADPRPFRLPDFARPYAARIISETVRSRARVFNGRKVRLASDLTITDVETGAPCIVERTTYFDSLVTNEFFFRQVRDRHGSVLFDGRALAMSNGLLRPLDDDRLSNHIGVSTVAVTNDRRVVLLTQGVRAAIQPGRVVASGSGSLDWRDTKRSASTLQDLVAAGADRELREECGIKRAIATTTNVIGFYRDVQRGGKPEFICFSQIDARFSELAASRKERFYVAALSDSLVRITRSDDFAADLRRILDDHDIVMTDGLRYHLTVLANLVDTEDTTVLGMIGLDPD